MTIDYTKDKMVWTPLNYKPVEPKRINGAGASGGLEIMGTLMKFLGVLAGAKAEPDYTLRGFLGVDLEDKEDVEYPVVKSVLADGPAAKAGLRAGDRITQFKGRSVTNTARRAAFCPESRGGRPGQTHRQARRRKSSYRDQLQDGRGPVNVKRLLCPFVVLLISLPAVRADAPKATVVPFELLPSGHMAVMVKVNGEGPYRLIFDTGAPITLLDNKVAKAAGLLKDTPEPLFSSSARRARSR